MRELKFRCWHAGHAGNGRMKAIPPQMFYDEGLGDCLIYKKQGQPVTVMQSTGLFDKNGKEIYEGDICNVMADSESFRGGKTSHLAEVKWDSEDIGFFYATNSGNRPHIKPWMMISVEVIGNIYENPELVTP